MQWNAMELQWKSESVGHRARGIFCKSRCFENENRQVGKTVDRPFMSISILNVIWGYFILGITMGITETPDIIIYNTYNTPITLGYISAYIEYKSYNLELQP